MTNETDVLVRPWIWLPAVVVILYTQGHAIHTGGSGISALYRFVWKNKWSRIALVSWFAITECHFHRIGPKILDPYAPFGKWLGPKVAR